MSTLSISPATPIPFKINNEYVSVPEDWTDIADTGDVVLPVTYDSGNTFNYTDTTPQTYTLNNEIIGSGNNTVVVKVSRSNTNSDFKLEFLDSSDTVKRTMNSIFSYTNTSTLGFLTDSNGDTIVYAQLPTDSGFAKLKITPETSTTISFTFSFKVPNTKSTKIDNNLTLIKDTVSSFAITSSKQYRFLIKESLFSSIVYTDINYLKIRLKDTANATEESFVFKSWVLESTYSPVEDGYIVLYFEGSSSTITTGLTTQTAVTDIVIQVNNDNQTNDLEYPITTGFKMQEQVNYDKALIPIMSGQEIERNTLFAEESFRGYMTQQYELPIPCTGISTAQIYWTETLWNPEIAIRNRTTNETVLIIAMTEIETYYWTATIDWNQLTCSTCYEVVVRKSIDNLLTDFDNGTFEDSTVANWNAESISGQTLTQETTIVYAGGGAGKIVGTANNDFILRGTTSITLNPNKNYELSAKIRYSIDPANDLLTDLFDYWDFNTNPTPSLNYAGQNSNLITFDADPVSSFSATSKNGNAYTVDDSSLPLFSTASFSTIGGFSVNFWFRDSSIATSDCYVVFLDGYSVEFDVITNGTELQFFDGITNPTSSLPFSLADDTYYMFTMIYDDDLDEISVYINSQYVDTYSYTANSLTNVSSAYTSGVGITKFMDELVTWTGRQLTASDITTLYNSGSGLFYSSFMNGTASLDLQLRIDNTNSTQTIASGYTGVEDEWQTFVTNINSQSDTSCKLGIKAIGNASYTIYVDEIVLAGPYIDEAVSEPINLVNDSSFLLCEYYNNSKGQGQYYTGGFKNRMYLPAVVKYAGYETETNTYTKSNGSIRLLNARVKELWELVTDRIPRYFHERIAVMLAHDNVNIDGTDYTNDEGYEVESKPRRKLQNGRAKLIRKNYNQQTNNC